MKITKGTIVRTILMIIVIINIVLERVGIDVIHVTEGGVSMFVETTIELAVIIVGFWKNNSYTQNAIKADKFLQELRESECE